MKLTIQNLKEVRRFLYSARRKWYSIGIELDLDIEDLKTIKAKYSDPGECLTEIIELWLKSIDPLPSWNVLGEALKSDPVEEAKLAKQAFSKHASFNEVQSDTTPPNVQETFTQQVVREEMPSNPNEDCVIKDTAVSKKFPFLSVETMTVYETKRLIARLMEESDEIKHKFGTLVAKTEKLLENSDTTAANLKSLFNTCSEELADITDVKDSIPEIVIKATKGKYWTFFNYSLLQSVINAYCASLTVDLKSYISDFKEYCQRRLYEVPRDVLQPEELPPNESQSIICVKLDDSYSLTKPVNDFLKIQYKLSKILDIEHLHLIHVKKGCIELTFRYFTKQPPIIGESKRVVLKKLGVLWISCGKQEVQLKVENENSVAEISDPTSKNIGKDEQLDKGTEAICASFEKLVSQTESCLQDCHITTDSFISFFRHLEMDELANSIESTDTVAAMFKKVRERGCWDFFNYELLREFISIYCSETPVISDLKSYISELKAFFQHSTLEVHYSALQDCTFMSIFSVKINLTPGMASIKLAQEQIAQILCKIVLLITVKNHSELTFGYFSNSNHSVFPITNRQKTQLAEIGVQLFICGNLKMQLKPKQEMQLQLEMFAEQNDYHQALAQGYVDVEYTQVIMVGLEGVGKSSLLNGLMNLPPTEKTESRSFLVKKNQEGYWDKIKSCHEITNIAQLMLMLPDTSQGHFSCPHVNAFVEEARNEILRLQSNTRTLPLSDQSYLRVWDVRGHAFFLDLLPSFITPRTLSLLVCDMRQDLSNPNSKELSHMIEWVATVHSTLLNRCPPHNHPRIIPIGTHADDDYLAKPTEEIFCPLTQAVISKKFDQHLQESIVVDITTAGKGEQEDPAFQKIRTAVDQFAASTVIPTPITWVLFRRVLERYARERPVVPLEEVKELARACSIPEYSLSSVLKFYHNLTVFLHYSWMPDFVIADPQWIVVQMSRILKLCDAQGILKESIYNRQLVDSVLPPQAIINVFEQLLLMGPYPYKHKKHYFIISKVSPWPQNSCANGSKYAAPLFLTFSTECVPCGFFTRLAVAFSKQPNCKAGIFGKNEIWYHFYGLPQKSIDVIKISLKKLSIMIEIDRYTHRVFKYPTILSTCQEIFKLLKNCFQDIKEWLPGANVVFAVKCEECAFDNHFVVLKGRDLITCQRNIPNTLTKKQKVWIYARQDYVVEVFPFRTLFLLLRDLDDTVINMLAKDLEVFLTDNVDFGKIFASIILLIDCWQKEMEMIGAPAVSQIVHHLECAGKSSLLLEYAAPLPLSYEQRLTPHGHVYYVDHKVCSVMWDRPQLPSIRHKMKQEAQQLGVAKKLPEYSLFDAKTETVPLLYIPYNKPPSKMPKLIGNFLYTKDTLIEIMAQRFRKMLFTLSDSLTLEDAKKIAYWTNLSAKFAFKESPDAPLYVLSWLEANDVINFFNVDALQSVIHEIGRHDLLPILLSYVDTSQYMAMEWKNVKQEPPQFFYTHEYDRKFKRLTLKLSEKLTRLECIAIADRKKICIPASAGDLDAALCVLSLWETTADEMKESFRIIRWTEDYFKFNNELARLESIFSSIGRHDLVKDFMEKEASLNLEQLWHLSYEDIFKWFDIGIVLGLDTSDLTFIHNRHPHDVVACLKAMLSLWLQNVTEAENEQKNSDYHLKTNPDDESKGFTFDEWSALIGKKEVRLDLDESSVGVCSFGSRYSDVC